VLAFIYKVDLAYQPDGRLAVDAYAGYADEACDIPDRATPVWRMEESSRHRSFELILRKIIKIVATRCQILRLKCTKFDFGWGCGPDPTGGAYSAPPDSLAEFKGAYF